MRRPAYDTIGLRVTDNGGATATTTRTVTVQNQGPTASFLATPNPAPTGSTVAFDAAASSDPDGTIAKYEWDLDGNGTYETDTGTTAAASASFPVAGKRVIGLRVTDNEGATATTTRSLTVSNRVPSASFVASPATAPTGTSVSFDASASKDPDGTISKYEWDLDGNGSYETNTGATAAATRTYATPGEVGVGLRVTDNEGATATTTQTVTAQNRVPSASFTASPTTAPTGTTVTFNASASSDPDGTISKYEWDLDGNGSYETNTGATATATSTYATPGVRTVALRVTDSNGATTTTTRTVTAQNRAPSASFTATPNPVSVGVTVSFNASASSDPDGTISKYEWDLDGNGSYETNTGATATATRSYAGVSKPVIGLRITDNSGATATATATLTVQNLAPTASFTASANPAVAGTTVTFNASASKDPDGTISKYEWDLDGNGSYETNGGAKTTATRSYSTASEPVVALRVTDNLGTTATTTLTLVVRGPYDTAVRATAGLIDYWRLGEKSGTSLLDSIGGKTATTANGVTLGSSGNLTLDANTAAGFDGSNDSASVPLNLTSTQKLTIEFWLRWTSFSNNDDLAFEFTPNLNNTNGGFIINPNATDTGSRFEVAIGRGSSRNDVYFNRPSSNAWHHYAFVFNTTLAGSQQVIPYVDGKAVSYLKDSSGAGAGAFANSTLYFMSRAGSSLFGKGTLDEVAIYSQALTATQISQHFAAR